MGAKGKRSRTEGAKGVAERRPRGAEVVRKRVRFTTVFAPFTTVSAPFTTVSAPAKSPYNGRIYYCIRAAYYCIRAAYYCIRAAAAPH